MAALVANATSTATTTIAVAMTPRTLPMTGSRPRGAGKNRLMAPSMAR